MSLASDLNYLAVGGYNTWDFVGFANLAESSKWMGLKIGNESITAIKISKEDSGWGDSDPSPEYSKKFPWVVLAMGSDDEHAYSRFSTEDAARKFADKLIHGNPVDIYDKKIWMYQN